MSRWLHSLRRPFPVAHQFARAVNVTLQKLIMQRCHAAQYDVLPELRRPIEGKRAEFLNRSTNRGPGAARCRRRLAGDATRLERCKTRPRQSRMCATASSACGSTHVPRLSQRFVSQPSTPRGADHLDQELQRLRNGHTTARSADSIRLEDHNGKASPMQDRSGRHLSHGHTQVCSFRLPHRERYNPNRRRGISLVLWTVGAELVSVVVKRFSRAGYDSCLEQTCVGGFVSLSAALLLQQMGATWPLRLHRNAYLT